MFWSLPPSTLGLDIKELQDFASEEGLPFIEEDWSLVWNAYGVKIARDNGVLPTASRSMGSIVSLCFTGLPCSCGTESYFDEETIEILVLEELLRISELDLTFREKSVKLLEFINDLYKTRIDDYSLLVDRVSIRLNINDVERLNDVEGSSLSDRVRFLIRNQNTNTE